jgi:hypothetical protein
MNHESSIGAFLLIALYFIYLVITLCISYYSYTCCVPIIRVLNLAIFLCYSNFLLRRRRWTGILWWGVLWCALPQLPFLWCYGVFRCSLPFHMRVDLVFRDIIYVINIIYSSHLTIFEHFWSVCVEQLIMGIHMMSTWLWHKNRVWHSWSVCAER